MSKSISPNVRTTKSYSSRHKQNRHRRKNANLSNQFENLENITNNHHLDQQLNSQHFIRPPSKESAKTRSSQVRDENFKNDELPSHHQHFPTRSESPFSFSSSGPRSHSRKPGTDLSSSPLHPLARRTGSPSEHRIQPMRKPQKM